MFLFIRVFLVIFQSAYCDWWRNQLIMKNSATPHQDARGSDVLNAINSL
jgi:hypothetical protein